MRSALSFIIGLCAACFLSWSTISFTPSSMYFSKSFSHDWSSDTINVVIGNSRSLSAIDCNELRTKNPWVHLGYSSSDISTQTLALRHAQSKAVHIDTVLWEISPFSFDERRVHRHRVFCRDLIQSHPPLISLCHSVYEASALFPNRGTLPNLRQHLGTNLSGDYSDRWHCDTITLKPLNQEILSKVFTNQRIQFDPEQIRHLDTELGELKSEGITAILLFTPSRRDFKIALSNYGEYKLMVDRLKNKCTVIDLDFMVNDSIFMDADHIACPTSYTSNFIRPALK